MPVANSLCAAFVNNDWSLCCHMTDGSLRLLNVDSYGVPIGSYDESTNNCLFAFEPKTIPMGPPGSKPSDFDPPIVFIDVYYPSQQSPIESIECRIVATNWEYDEGADDSSYRVSVLVGDVDLMASGYYMAGDASPLVVTNVIT